MGSAGANAMAADPTKLCYFSLSGEVRNQILDYVLVPGRVYVCSTTAGPFSQVSDSRTGERFRPGIQILATCKQNYLEGYFRYYSANLFHLPSGSVEDTVTWANGLHPTHKGLVQRISLTVGLVDLTPASIEEIEALQSARKTPAHPTTDFDSHGGDARDCRNWGTCARDIILQGLEQKLQYIVKWNSLQTVEILLYDSLIVPGHPMVFTISPLRDPDRGKSLTSDWLRVLRLTGYNVKLHIREMVKQKGWDEIKKTLCSSKRDIR